MTPWSKPTAVLLAIASLGLVGSSVAVWTGLGEIDAMITSAAPDGCRSVSRRLAALVLIPGVAMVFAGFLALRVGSDVLRDPAARALEASGRRSVRWIGAGLVIVSTAVVVAGFAPWTRSHGLVAGPVVSALAAGALVAFAARASDASALARVVLVTTWGVIAVSGVVSGIELFVRGELLDAVAAAGEADRASRLDTVRVDARTAGLELKRLVIVPIVAALPALVMGRRSIVAALGERPGRLALAIAFGLLFAAPVWSSVALKARWETACGLR